MLRYDIRDSGYNIFGRLGLVAFVVGVMFLNFFLFGPFANKDITGMWLFFGSQMLFIFAAALLFIGWGLTALFATFVYWVATDEWEFTPIFESPKHAGYFMLKFLFGDWNRADLFRRHR